LVLVELVEPVIHQEQLLLMESIQPFQLLPQQVEVPAVEQETQEICQVIAVDLVVEVELMLLQLQLEEREQPIRVVPVVLTVDSFLLLTQLEAVEVHLPLVETLMEQ
jgi:hypothetical protein